MTRMTPATLYWANVLKMPDSITDGPQFEDDHTPDSTPGGHQVINELPNDLANEYIIDEAVNEGASGKCFIIEAIDAAHRGEDRIAGDLLRKCRRQAGESEAAISDWRRIMDWVQGNG